MARVRGQTVAERRHSRRWEGISVRDKDIERHTPSLRRDHSAEGGKRGKDKIGASRVYLGGDIGRLAPRRPRKHDVGHRACEG